MRNRMQDFMYGRYGSDELNRFIWIVAMIVVILDLILTRMTRTSRVLWIIAVVLIVVGYWRMLSRDTARRSMENEKFLGFTSHFRRGGRTYGGRGYDRGSYGGNRYGRSQSTYSRQESAERRKAQRQDKKYYKYFNCPNCNQKVRVPKGRGKIEITCPKCRTSFIRKT